MESRRSQREPVCHCLSLGEYSGSESFDELCRADGGAFGSECSAVRLVTDAVFDGADRMGAGATRGTECARLSQAGGAGFFLRNRGGAGLGEMGARECF